MRDELDVYISRICELYGRKRISLDKAGELMKLVGFIYGFSRVFDYELDKAEKESLFV